MDETIKQLIIQVGFAAVFLWQLRMVYNDLKANQVEAKQEREMLINAILDLKSRAKNIELATTGDTAPTIADRRSLT